MEEIIYLALVILVFIAVIPILILIKISSINNNNSRLHADILEMKFKINELTEFIKKQKLLLSDEKEQVEEVKEVIPESIPDPVPSFEIKETSLKEDVQESIVAEAIVQESEIKPVEMSETNEPEPIILPESEPIPEPILYSATESIESKISKKTLAEKSMIEKFLTENLLSKIGIVTLILGIGFFVKYAIDQDWINETGRVGIGILTGGLLIGIAHKLRKQYSLFSSILVGGGFAVFYITISLAFREYQLFSQTVAFILLMIVTLLSVIFSLYYDKKELAVFSLLGGFASPLMISTGSGNYIVLFSCLLIFNTGMLLVSAKRDWPIVGKLAYILTMAFFWGWLSRLFEDEYIGAFLFAMAFFVQFYILAFFRGLNTENKLSKYQVFLIFTNNLSAYLACIYIFNNYNTDLKGVITIGFALLNGIVLYVLFRKSSFNKLFVYFLIAIVLTFISLAIPVQLNGNVITMFWAAEMVILLWLWQRSGIAVFRSAFLILTGLVSISYLMDINRYYFDYYNGGMRVVANKMFITGIIVIIAFFICRWLLKKEDPQDYFKLNKNMQLCTVGQATKMMTFGIIAFTYFVPCLELNYHLTIHFFDKFNSVMQVAYAAVYIAILIWIYRNNQSYRDKGYLILISITGILALLFTYYTRELSDLIYYRNENNDYLFAFHLIALPAFAWIIYFLAKNIREVKSNSTYISWALVIISVLLLSLELENLTIMIVGIQENYYSLLNDVRTFGYPILWGVIAMILMIWGLKSKEVLLRKISLTFFGIIILKFYSYDVWKMSQAGRIVSFVMLGVILLVVSFLQQKIKVIVKDEKQTESIESEKNEIKNENTADNITDDNSTI